MRFRRGLKKPPVRKLDTRAIAVRFFYTLICAIVLIQSVVETLYVEGHPSKCEPNHS